jgi:Tol biopolymer transport system component
MYARMAFEAAVDGNTDVYLVGTDGGRLRRLTTEPSIDEFRRGRVTGNRSISRRHAPA